MTSILSIKDIKNMFIGGKKNLEAHKEEIDNLNVFPVPDGDTGTNMFLTMSSTVKELEAENSEDINDICRAITHGAIRGARGNSGVILSQIFKGIAEVFSKSEAISTLTLATALKRGSEVAYNVVSNPKEGTILTLIRQIAEFANEIAYKYKEFEDFLPEVLKKGEESLANTPNLLPILKSAGVVDSGAKGLLIILYGIYFALIGKEIKIDEQKKVAIDTDISFDDDESGEIKYSYCTEFFITELNETATLSDIDSLRTKLKAIGDCVLVVGDLSLVKVHVHTNNPDIALCYALQLGQLDKPKIENMLLQNKAFKKPKAPVEKKKNALISICSGEGIKALFKELGADLVLEGGQTMNPSVTDIVKVANEANAKNVFLLTNNGNIILAAEQAVNVVENNLVVIATKTICEGVSAAMNFDADLSVEDNINNMQNAYRNVLSGQVTYSVKDTEFDGKHLKAGDIIGIVGNKLIAKQDNAHDTALDLISNMVTKDTNSITLYYGQDVSKIDAEKLCDVLQDKYSYCDVQVINGGQKHYHYYVSVE